MYLKYALQLYKALECRGIARVDLIIQDNLRPIILEINTVPGMTNTSDIPAQGKKDGYSFGEIVEYNLIYSL